VCITLCTIVAHNIAHNRPDNFSSYPPDNHHCSDDVYLREGGVYVGRNVHPHVYGAKRLWTNRLWGEMSSVWRNVHGANRPWGERSISPWGELSVGRKVYEPYYRCFHYRTALYSVGLVGYANCSVCSEILTYDNSRRGSISLCRCSCITINVRFIADIV